MLVWKGQCWFTRFAQASLNAWSREGKPLALEQKDQRQDDQEAKAMACSGGGKWTGSVALQPWATQWLYPGVLDVFAEGDQREREAGPAGDLGKCQLAQKQGSPRVGQRAQSPVKQEGGVRLLT
jgi:hypothetical protein